MPKKNRNTETPRTSVLNDAPKIREEGNSSATTPLSKSDEHVLIPCKYCKAKLSSDKRYNHHLRKAHSAIVSKRGQRLCDICHAVVPVKDFDQHRKKRHKLNPIPKQSWVPVPISSPSEDGKNNTKIEHTNGSQKKVRRFVQGGLCNPR